MTLSQVTEHIRRHDGCDEANALDQLAHAIADRKVWPEWDDTRVAPMGSESLPILSDDDDSPTTDLEYWQRPEIDPGDPDRIREQRSYDPGYVDRRTAAKLEAHRRYRKPLFPWAHVRMRWPAGLGDASGAGVIVARNGPTAPPKPASGTSSNTKHRTGPQPATRNRVLVGMLADYANEPNRLDLEKQVTLAARYGVSRDTAQKARVDALTQLRHNPSITTA